jgi:hypothetical protein
MRRLAKGSGSANIALVRWMGVFAQNVERRKAAVSGFVVVVELLGRKATTAARAAIRTYCEHVPLQRSVVVDFLFL